MFTPCPLPWDAAGTQAVPATQQAGGTHLRAEPASLLGRWAAAGDQRGQSGVSGAGMAFQPPYSPSLFRRRDW